MIKSGHLNSSEETGTGCPVISKYGRTPPNKHACEGRQQLHVDSNIIELVLLYNKYPLFCRQNVCCCFTRLLKGFSLLNMTHDPMTLGANQTFIGSGIVIIVLSVKQTLYQIYISRDMAGGGVERFVCVIKKGRAILVRCVGED